MRRFVVSGLSMSPALADGEQLETVPVALARRGGVLVFEHPAQPGFWLVKRVVGLPGETVEIAAGMVLIDGVGYDDPWSVEGTDPPGRWFVPPLHVFVLSDARHRSLADSRTFGPVPLVGAYEPLDP